MSKVFNKIRNGLKEVLEDIENKFGSEEYIDEPRNWDVSDYEEEPDTSSPYEGASWGPADCWHCIRCGHHLREIDEEDRTHGKACYSDMRKDGTLHYQCSNEKCFHYSAPLILHHPIGGFRSPAGESYSISWVR